MSSSNLTWRILDLTNVAKTRPNAPYWVFGPAAAAQVGVAFYLGTASWFRVVVLFALGLSAWSFIEYLLHRFSFHSRSNNPWVKPFNSGLHLEHHNAPQSLDFIAAPMRLAVPIYLIFLGLCYAVSRDAESVAYLSAGIIAGYLAYEWVHYSAHLRSPKSKLMRYLKRYHMIHHFQNKDNFFGVTSPLFDYLFGTHPASKTPATAKSH